jgi:predicted Zn finger-like uncharacterized protein
MYTQCPQCRTVLEIGAAALQTSGGIVACGQCGACFEALPFEPEATLTAPGAEPDAPSPGPVAATPGREAAAGKDPTRGGAPRPEAPPEPIAQSIRGMTIRRDWFGMLHTNLTAALIAGTASGGMQREGTWRLTEGRLADAFSVPEVSAPLSTETSVTLREANPEPLAGVAEVEADLPTLDAGASSTDPADAAKPPAPLAESEADPGAPAEATPADRYEPVCADHSESDLPPRSADGAERAKPTDAPMTLPGPESVLAVAATPDTEAAPRTTLEDLQDTATRAPVYVRPGRQVSRAGTAWAVGCLVLMVILVVQLVWAKRGALIANPGTRPWMARVCRTLPCHLPLMPDVAKLQLLSRDVRPDPHRPGALTITATLRNAAPFRQPWPVVTVVLSDLDGKPVAMRRFRPTEYMSDPARRIAGMGPRTTTAVAFEVADPGKRAVSFQFGFQ